MLFRKLPALSLKAVLTFAATGGMLTLSAPAQAQGDQAYMFEVLSEFLDFSPEYSTQEVVFISYLADGERAKTRVYLEAGEPYSIEGGCDLECNNVNMWVSGPSGENIGHDDLDDGFPEVRFVAKASGYYEVETVMDGCDLDHCAYGFVVLSK